MMSAAGMLCIYLLGLSLVFCEQHGGLDDSSLPPTPAVVGLKPVDGSQSLVVMWRRSRGGRDVYEVQVSRAQEQNVIYSTNVSVTDEDSAEHSWTWVSGLPLECVDHFVRIRNFCNQSSPSPWSSWMTNHGIKAKDQIEMFPFKRLLREGSTATFCCVPPAGVSIRGITFRNKHYPVISVGPRVKAITVHNLTIPTGRFKRLLVTCVEAAGNPRSTWYPVSFPPQKPRNLSCVTSDMTTVTCTWDSGREKDPHDHNKRTHTLHFTNTDRAPIECKPSSCSFPVVPHLQEYYISVVVRDELGEEKESYSFNISERVRPVLEWDRVTPGVTDVNISWSVRGNLTQSDFLCQISTAPDTSHDTGVTQLRCTSVSSLCKVRLGHLNPNTKYSTRVCCSVDGRLWGDWTPTVHFTTYPQVTLDLWRQIQQLSNSHLRRVTLLWKPNVVGRAATVNVRGYTLQWSQEGKVWKEVKESGQKRAEVSIGPGKCDFTVQAVVQTGSSVAAHMAVPPADQAENLPTKSRLSSSSAGGFNLSWSEPSAGTCGFTVEWCLLGRAVPCALEWVKVPKGNNTLFLPAGHFTAGCRYSFSIYGCTESGHKLLEIQTGYSRELNSVQAPSLVEPVQSSSSSVTLEWHYNEDDPGQPAFITGYLVTVQEAGSPSQAAKLVNVSVSDPRQKSVTIEGLQQDQEYVCSLSALTKEGPGIPLNITIKTRTDYSSHLAKGLSTFFLLLVCSIFLWTQLKRLKTALKEIFIYPAGMNIKTPEFESFLYETDQWTQSQRVEECICCDIEILNVKPLLNQTNLKGDPELKMLCSPGTEPCALSVSPSCEPVQADYRPQSDTLLWDRPAQQQMMCIANKSYLSTADEILKPHESIFSEISSNFEISVCQQESCTVIYGYISEKT
ncbi:leukemia inhibitory factor receptor [Cololabis saira]|uniref:leukemia inhibitory factor receptor n=1 Tax=Cololabis saira TaxID=129043 RepID=UPI002AD3003E|nr:leukemia inhibitory factor receptor [Cololabis saira]